MLEVIVGQMVMMGSWGLEAIAVSRWMIWRERRMQQQQHQEEELETRYVTMQDHSVSDGVERSPVSEPNSLNDVIQNSSTPTLAKDPRLVGWEFKIVRAKIDLFREAKQLHKLCEEESQAGWILLEKLDDRRVRFKRPIAIRDLIDIKTLNFDPYRCHYGPRITGKSYWGAIALMGSMIFPAGLGYVWVNGSLNQTRPMPSPEPVVSPVAEPFPTRPLTSTPWPQNEGEKTD